MLTNHKPTGTALTFAMTALALVTIDILNDWVGDVGALLWIASGFWWPFLVGIAWGHTGGGKVERFAGGIVGAAIVLVPGVGYAIFEQPDLAELHLPLLWTLFTPLAFAQGALSLPMGVRVRKPS